MSFPFKRSFSYLVLFSFFFQTLWPSVVFATDGGVEVLRPPIPSSFSLLSSLADSPTTPSVPARPVVAIAPFSLQAFVDDQLEGFDDLSAKPVVLFPGAASLAEAQDWFDDSFEAQSLYPGLVVTEQGLLWSQYGLNFLIGLNGHLFVAPLLASPPTTKKLRLHNYHGDVVFGGGLSLSHAQVQARNILQASSSAVIERLEIWAMGTVLKDGSTVDGRFTNREGSNLTTSQVMMHEGHLENRGDWKVVDGGVIDCQGHDFINEESLTLGGQASVKNQGTFGNTGTVKGASYTLEMVKGENAGIISGEAPHIVVSESLTNQVEAKILGKSSLTVSGEGTVDNQGSVASEKALALENKTFTNQGLVHSDGTLHLALQEKLTNTGTGSVVVLGQTTITGKAMIHNEAPTCDHAGMAFGGGVHFDTFQGGVLNAGLMTSQTTMTGLLRKLVNTGTFGVNGRYQGFRILDFLNEKTGILLGEGFITLMGINRGLMQADRLSIDIEGTFLHEKGAVLKGKTAIETRGRGTFIRQGNIQTPSLTLDSAGFENAADFADDKMVVVVGANASKWRNKEKAFFKVGQLTLEAGRGVSSLGDFANDGTMEIGRFINRRSGFTNRHQMTLKHWEQRGAVFKNELGGIIDVFDSSEVEADTIDNDGDINWEGTLRGRIRQFLNQGGVTVKGDAKLTGTRLANSKNFKALGIFDWFGETLENTNTGKMTLFDNRVIATRQVINEGLLLWTHNTFKTWHFLNMGWAEMTQDLTAVMPTTFKAPTDRSRVFKKSMVENRGVLKLAPKDYTPRMTIERGGDFAHWLNQGDMILPDTHLRAQSFRNEGDIVVEGNLTGFVETFENIKKMVTTGSFDLKGKSLTNSGSLKGKKGVAYNGEAITTTDGSELTAQEAVVLTATTPLTLRGKVQSKQGMTLTAPQIENRAKLTVRTGKAIMGGDFKNYGHFNVDEWVYEGAEFLNEGVLEANTYHRTTPFRRLVNGAGKTLIIRRGGFTAQQIQSRGKLELSNGVYRFESWDNKDGTADIDQLCLALLNPLLQGKLDANVLLPFASPYDSLTIMGETVFRKGGFVTKKLTTRQTLTIGDGAYVVDQLDSEPKAQIHLLPKAQLELKERIDNQGDIISETGLEIMTRKETPASFIRTSVTNPRILLDSFWGRDKTSSYAIRRFGGLSVTETLSLFFGTEKHIEYFLGENVSQWAVGKTFLLKGDLFENDWRTLQLPWFVDMSVGRFDQKGGALKTNGLRFDSQTFRLGESNDRMGRIEVHGPLTMTVAREGIDCRFGMIQATGKGEVTCSSGDIQVGAPKASVEKVEDESTGTVHRVKQKTIHEVELLKQNGAKIITGGELELHSHRGNIITSFGSVHGNGGVYLYTGGEHTITNQSGSITSYNRILLVSEALENLIGDVIEFDGHPFDFCRVIAARHRQHPKSGPGIIASTGGDISLNIRRGRNIGSQILTPKSVRYWNGRSYTETRPSSFEVKELPLIARLEMIFTCGLFFLNTDREVLPSIPSPVRGGESLDIETGLLHLTGTMSAPKVKVRGDRLNAHTLSGRTATVLEGDVEIDLRTFYEKLKKTLPVITDFIQRQNQKSIQDEAVVLEQRGGSLVPARSFSFGSSLPPLALTDDALKFTVMFVLSDILGTLNIGGRSGDQLLASLYKKAKTIEKQLKKEGQLITKDRFQSFHEGMIYSVVEQIGTELLRVPKMLVTPEMVNPYGQTSGAITGTALDLEFKDGVEGRPTLHAAAPLADKRETGRHLEDEEEEEARPLRGEPKLDLTVIRGDVDLTDGLVQNTGGAVSVKTKESGSINLTATQVEGEGDVIIDSAEHVRLESTSSRTGYGETFADRMKQASATSRKGKLTIKSKLDTVFTGAKTFSALGTTFEGKGRLIDQTLALVSQSVIRDGENYTRDTYITKQFSHHQSSAGSITASYDGRVDLVATQYEVAPDQDVVILGLEGVTAHEDHNVHEHEAKQKKGARGWFGRSSTSHFQSSSQTSIGVKVKGGKARFISAGDIILTNVDVDANQTILTSFDGVVKILPGTNYFTSQFSGKSADLFWQSMTQRVVQQKTYTDSKFSGTIETYAKEVILQQVCGRTLSFMDRLKLNGATLTFDYVQELYDVKEKTVSGPTAALSAVISLAASIAAVATGGATAAGAMAVSATGATGATAGIISAMGYAGFSALCAQATMALAQNKLHIGRAAKDLVGKDSLKALVKAMAVAGLVAGTSQFLGTPASATDASTRATADAAKTAEAARLAAPTAGQLFDASLAHQAAFHAANMGASLAVDVAMGGSLEKAFGPGALGFAAGLVGGLGANQIGAAYAQNVLDAFTHKLLHAGLGAATGAIMAGEKGAVAGAMGAFVAETFADAFSPEKPMEKIKDLEAEKGRKLTAQEFTQYYDAELKVYKPQAEHIENWARITAATTALLAGQDVTVAAMAATNAVQNNFLLVAFYGVVAANLAYSSYKVYNAYEEGGAQAALNQLGIEVAINVGGAVAGRAVGMVVYKVGGMAYPTVAAALTAVLDKTPGLRLALGKLVDKLVLASEKIGQSALGKGVAKAEEALSKMEAKLGEKLVFKAGAERAADTVGREIILTDGFYQAEKSAFKFSEYYYKKLWDTGRGAPFLQAEEVFKTAKTVIPDRMPGFNRYVNDTFEMIYNPTTKEVWHLQPLGR